MDHSFINYHYEAALKLLREGTPQVADSLHQIYAELRPHPKAIDDYPFKRAKQIAEAEGLPAARSYLQAKRTDAELEGRRAQFRYVEGEMLLNAEKPQQARQVFQATLSEHADLGEFGREFLNYSKYGLAASYLAEGRGPLGNGSPPTGPPSDSGGSPTQKGLRMLRQWSQEEETPDRWKRQALETLVGTHQRRGRPERAARAAGHLAKMGTPAEQAEARLRQQRLRIEAGRPQAALQVLDSLKAARGGAMGPEDRAELMRLKGRVHLREGREAQARELLEQVTRQFPETPAAGRAERALQRGVGQRGPGGAPPGGQGSGGQGNPPGNSEPPGGGPPG